MFRRAFIGMALGLAMAVSLPVQAAPVATPPGQGLEISPPVLELTANPGQTVTANIKLRNVAGGELIAKGKVNDFGAKDETGDPKIILDDSEISSYSLKTWIKEVPNLTLAPQEVKTATVNISVPANAEPGGHYGVIRFTATPTSPQGTGVALSASIGTLVLLRVSGQAREKLEYDEFFVSRQGKRGSFFESGPLNFTERIKNSGNLHEKPTGQLVITNMFGTKVATLKINDPARNVLPDSIRRFDQTLAKSRLFGRYRARADLSYGSTKQTLASPSLVFWVIPYKLLALAILLLIALIIIIKRLIGSYNRRIIARSKRQ